jgi:hypothetical protein
LYNRIAVLALLDACVEDPAINLDATINRIQQLI